MKRSPLTRRTPLGPGAKSLQRRSTFKRPKRLTVARVKWDTSVRGMPCFCGCDRPAFHGHHLIEAQVLKRAGASLTDERNRAPVSPQCHMDHHNWARRLPRPAPEHPVWTFAQEWGLVWWLDLHYPEGT